jgi:hypothetical protein
VPTAVNETVTQAVVAPVKLLIATPSGQVAELAISAIATRGISSNTFFIIYFFIINVLSGLFPVFLAIVYQNFFEN